MKHFHFCVEFRRTVQGKLIKHYVYLIANIMNDDCHLAGFIYIVLSSLSDFLFLKHLK